MGSPSFQPEVFARRSLRRKSKPTLTVEFTDIKDIEDFKENYFYYIEIFNKMFLSFIFAFLW